MHHLNKLVFPLVALLPSVSFAFFCPTNFQQIDFGNTMDQVIAQCGNPTFKDEVKKQNQNIPQEWSYFVSQTVATQSMSASQGTLKTQFVFDKSGKLINISVNGVGVGSTSICGSSVQLGDSKEAVKSACGDPSFINKQQPTSDQPPQETTVTTFVYGETSPATRLIFENGVLKDKQ